MQNSILNVFVEREQVGMTFPHSDPDNCRTGTTKDSHPCNRQEERGNPHSSERIPQLFLRRCTYVRDEAYRHMQLIEREPPQTPNVRIKSDESFATALRHFECDEQALCHFAG
jgi:hypothetical protein